MKGEHIMNTGTYDWRMVIEKKPKGFATFNNGEEILHGPIDKIFINEHDDVEIHLKWAARVRISEEGIEPTEKWSIVYEKPTLVQLFPNMSVCFLIQDITGKIHHVKFGRFGSNTICINEGEGIIESFEKEKMNLVPA